MPMLGSRSLTSLAAALALAVSNLAFASPAPAAIVVKLDANDTTITDSVTETAEAEPGITPAPVRFPNPCTVVIPTTPHVTYFVDFHDGDHAPIAAGTYDGTEFDSDRDPVVFFADAEEGFEIAEDAPALWEYTVPKKCFPDVVKVKATCGEVTFTNVLGESVIVVYGKDGRPPGGGEFALAVGRTRTVKTTRSRLRFVAFSRWGSRSQTDYVAVPQGCGSGVSSGNEVGSGSGNGNGSGRGKRPDHPAVAPAAGVASPGDSRSTPERPSPSRKPHLQPPSRGKSSAARA